MARQLIVDIVGNARDLGRSLNDANGQVQGFGQKLKGTMKTVGIAAGAALAAGAVATVAAGLQGLREGAAAESALTDALSRSSAAMRGQEEALKSNAEALQRNTKFSYEDALAIDTVIAKQQSLTGVIEKGIVNAVDLTNTTADLATVLGVDGAAAAEQLAKAMAKPESASKLLQKAGVDLTGAEEAKLKALVKSGKVTDAQAFIMGKLQKATEGAAEAAGGTLEGRIVRAQAAFGEMQEGLALALLPAFEAVTDIALKFSTWAQDNPGKVKLVVAVVAGLAAVIGVVSLATKAWAAMQAVATAATTAWQFAQTKLNLAMLANPIGLVVLAVVALVAAFVVAYQKSETFRKIVQGAFNGVKNAASAVFTWLKENWPLLLAILTGPFGLAVLAIVKNWDRIKSGATAAKDWVVQKFDKLVGFVTGLPGRISRAASGMFGGVTSAFKSAINAIVGGWNRLEFRVPGFKIGPIGYDGFSLGVPDIPYLAKGGVARGGRPHVVGEKGPELFIPGATGSVVSNQRLMSALADGGSAGGGGPVKVTFDVTGADEDLKKWIRKMVRIEGGGDVQVAFGRG